MPWRFFSTKVKIVWCSEPTSIVLPHPARRPEFTGGRPGCAVVALHLPTPLLPASPPSSPAAPRLPASPRARAHLRPDLHGSRVELRTSRQRRRKLRSRPHPHAIALRGGRAMSRCARRPATGGGSIACRWKKGMVPNIFAKC
jgi:hypothetical protein